MTAVPPSFDPMETKHDSEFDDSIPRDRYGRPMLLPEGGTVRLPYTRASSLADFISNKRGLVIWQQRHLARGLGMRPDLAMLAATETYNTGFGMTDAKENKASGRRLDEIITRAQDVSLIHERADYGTSIHHLTEQGNTQPVSDPIVLADVESFQKAMRGITELATEVFVACDEVMAAGSFDHLVRLPGRDRAQVLDKKTGALHMEGFGVQLAVYANGEMYENDERFSLESQFGPIDREKAIVAHIAARTGRTVFYEIDIIEGLEAARYAAWVRDYQSRAHTAPPLDLDEIARLGAMSEMWDGREAGDVNLIYAKYADVWNDDLTSFANRHGGNNK